MKPVYFYNRGEFVMNGIGTWTNYETMISTAKDIQRVLEGGYDYETLKNIQETLEKVIRYYDGFENDESIDVVTSAACYSANLGRLKDDVKEAMAYYTMEGTGWLGSAYYQNKGFLKNCMTKIDTKLRDMSRGVVYDGPGRGNHFFHILNPEQDIHTYNGRDFYLWDGWHSSLKVMKEIADKRFNA